MPLAHAAHVLVDVAFFVVPVGTIGVTLLILNRRERGERRRRN
jgi:hypothetical protein